MEAKLHLELQSIETELSQLQSAMDSIPLGNSDEYEGLYQKWLTIQKNGKRVAKELQNLMAKRDNCNAQKHQLLKKYPNKYKSLKDLDYLDKDYTGTIY